MGNWQISLSLIPSIAVILTSTNRMALGLTDEINLRLLQNKESFQGILPLKIKQLRRLSLSIIYMYISFSLLVVSALLAALEIINLKQQEIFMLISIVIFLVALFLKIQFSYHAYKIRQKQFLIFLK